MSSWNSEKSCKCFYFLFCDQFYELEHKVNHDYKVTISLSNKEDSIYSFSKTIVMDAKSNHKLTDYVFPKEAGTADTEVASFNKPTINYNTIPWAETNAFTKTSNDYTTYIKDIPYKVIDGIISSKTSTINSKWSGTLADKIKIIDGSVFANNAYENTTVIEQDTYEASGSTSSSSPVGYADALLDGGIKTKWIDEVGFKNYQISGTLSKKVITNILTYKYEKLLESITYNNTYNIIGNYYPIVGILDWYQLIEGLGDSLRGTGDGYQMGMGTWAFSGREDKYYNINSLIENIVTTTTNGIQNINSFYLMRDLNNMLLSSWKGSVCSSRLAEDKRYLLYSDQYINLFYEIQDSGLLLLKNPEEITCYSACPL